MEGEVLYPLNVLKEKYPDLYAAKAAKYTGREQLMEQVIPTLNCLWNDVLHMTAVFPQVVKDALVEAGGSRDLKMACYKIDPHLLDPEKTIVYLCSSSGVDKTKAENFVSFNPDEMGKYAFLPQETKDYYKETYQKGSKPLVFRRVVHILYKGSIHTKDFPIVEV